MKPVDLHISFEGNVPGLQEGRLSMASFGSAIARLLTAYRRIASGIVKDALAKPGYGDGGGRFAKEAAGLDFELSAITHESPVTMVLSCTAPPLLDRQPALFPDELVAEAGQTLLKSIEMESQGHLRNRYVRRYLEALPAGVERQMYKLSRDSNVIQSTVVSAVTLAAQAEWPVLDIVSANVIGVGFEPGNSEIRIKSDDSKAIATSASSEMVETALNLRGTTVDATFWKEAGKKARLIGIVPTSTSRRGMSHEKKKQLLFEEWDGVLRRLSR